MTVPRARQTIAISPHSHRSFAEPPRPPTHSVRERDQLGARGNSDSAPNRQENNRLRMWEGLSKCRQRPETISRERPWPLGLRTATRRRCRWGVRPQPQLHPLRSKLLLPSWSHPTQWELSHLPRSPLCLPLRSPPTPLSSRDQAVRRL